MHGFITLDLNLLAADGSTTLMSVFSTSAQYSNVVSVGVVFF